MSDLDQHPAIVAAIKIFGSQAKLVSAIGCFSQQTVSRVLNRESPASAELAVAIHTATGGKVPKWTVRPDLFDAPMEVA